MKKLVSVLLIMMLIITACSSKEASKTKEELKAEIKAEMEAEANMKEELKAQIRAELEAEQKIKEKKNEKDEIDLKENQKKSEVNQDFVDGISITGDLSYNYAPYFLTLDFSGYNEPAISVSGKEYTKIMFEKDIISQYIDRHLFSYNPEGFAVLNFTKHTKPIVKIEFDESTVYDTDLEYLCVKDYKVLEVNYKKPVDKTKENYPIKYYQDVISSLCFFMYGANESDVKQNPGYNGNEDFKEAVDIAIEKDYKVVQNDGCYRIASDSVIDISSPPTLNEICEIVGISISDLTTHEDGGYYMYSTNYSNDEISFQIYHDEKNLTGNEKVYNISVTSPKYSLCGIKFGDRLIDTYNLLDSKYENVIDHHSASGKEKVKYVYSVNGFCLYLNDYSFGYEDEKISDAELVKEIHVFELLD